jgi:hypothetical protein
MTPAEQVNQLQERLARAVASGAFEEAGRLLQPYSALAEQAALELPPPEREEFASRVLGFCHWAISLARTSRALACAQLRELSAPSPYRSLPARSPRHWQYDA